jgi:hypothetical protein
MRYFVPSANAQIVDARAHAWMLHDIYETAALAAILTIFAFSIVTALRLAESKISPPACRASVADYVAAAVGGVGAGPRNRKDKPISTTPARIA